MSEKQQQKAYYILFCAETYKVPPPLKVDRLKDSNYTNLKINPVYAPAKTKD